MSVTGRGTEVDPAAIQLRSVDHRDEEMEYEERQLVEVRIDFDESRVADDTLDALRADKTLFTRSNELVRIVPGNPTLIAKVTKANLRETISQHVRFATEEYSVPVPPYLVPAILDRATWRSLRPLRGVRECPFLAPGGAAVEDYGYDAATEVYLAPSTSFPPCKEAPTHADALTARDELLEAFVDFPFEKETHRASAIAAVLTIVARFAVDGPTPLFAIDKNVRGAGGSLLADVIVMIGTGSVAARMTGAKDAEEERKKITSIAIAGDAVALIDNVNGPLGTDALNAALTGTTWRDRLLGTNTVKTLPLHTVWFATGNNLEFHAETLRRTVHIRLESPEERPEERSNFRHPDLIAWTKEERPRLYVAALTMLRAYFVAGCPSMDLRAWGSFSEWSRVVRETCVWSGLEDPGKTREELSCSADGERTALAELLVGWREMFGEAGGTVADCLKRIKDDNFIPEHLGLESALAELCPMRPGAPPSARAIGARFRAARGRVIGGLALAVREGNDRRGTVWVVREVSTFGDSGDLGDSFLPVRILESGSSGGGGGEPGNPRGREQSPKSPQSPPDVDASSSAATGKRLRRRSEANAEVVVQQAIPFEGVAE